MLYFYEQDGAWCFLSQKLLGIVHRKGGKRGPTVLVPPAHPGALLSSVPQGRQAGEGEPVGSVFPSSPINGSLSPFFCRRGCCLSISRAEMAALFFPALLCMGWRGKFLTSLVFPLSSSSQDLEILENIKFPSPWHLKLLSPELSNRELWKAEFVKLPRLSICSCGIAIKHLDYPKYPAPTKLELIVRKSMGSIQFNKLPPDRYAPIAWLRPQQIFCVVFWTVEQLFQVAVL